ncbi:putative Ig domain-containing protein [Fibrella forsythiae]|uniref:Ig domain-containing protein n=1 Tax=Fibrella forsythiae TaxID=2817061 RepID=A0ABS3JRE5_9BACT|nr:putative Ig domain-containing protein [Fibrella forsythiae]MBO0952569.1 putative Ig domain-containing protein [Fibrella forsythiae]
MNARLRFFQRITGLRVVILLMGLLSLSLKTQAQTIRYVRPTSSGNGSGTSWTNASGNLQAMIDASASSDQVWVAAGIYKPGGSANTNRSISFVMKNGVAIYGGFVGNETLLTQRPVINPITGQPSSTTLSGEIGSAGTTDNSYHVVNNDQTGIDNTAVLDGFVITGGNAAGENGNARAGGGMLNVLTSPTVRNCSFQANTATTSGGGMYNGDANPRLTNCSFQANIAVVGGGMCTIGGNPILTNCGFQANTGNDSGGGMYNSGANVRLTNCSFQANTAGIGGGIDNEGSSSSILLNCSFQSNTANNGGGLFTNPSSTANLINCSFQGNSASDGGAVYAENTCSLTNCVLFGNGGANTLTTAGRGTVTLRYSLIEASETGYTNGGSNLTATVSPFVSTTSTQLNGCAPAIDAGNLSAYTTAGGPTTDLAGNPRSYNSGPIDMGAYEFQAASANISLTNPTIRSGEVNVFFSQPFSASGGTSPRSFSVASGSLPAGLTLSAAGVLSGTPTQDGSFTITVRATDANGCSATGSAYVLTIVDNRPVIENYAAVNPTVCAGNPLTFTATVSNISGSYNFTLTNGISTSFTGTRVGASFSQNLTSSGDGTQSFTLTISDNSQSTQVVTQVTVNPLPIASLTSSGPLSCTNASVTLTAAGGTSYTFTRGGVVIGTPGSLSTVEVTESGTYSVRVASASGCVSTTSTTVTSTTATVAVTNPTTRSGTVNVFFSQTFSASGGTTPRSFSVASGTLPTGLTLSAAGVLSGTPTQAGNFPITVQVTDANGCSDTGSAYVLTIVDNRPAIENFAPVNPTVCVGGLVTFTATVGNVSGSYNFTLTNGINTPTIGVKVASNFSQNVLASGSGTQSFSLIITGNGLSARATTEVTVSPLPMAGLSNSGPLSCTNTSVTLTATGGSSYTFTNNNGDVLAGMGNTRTVSIAGTYQVRVATASGCVSTTSTTVTSTTATVSLTNPTTRNGSVNVFFSQTFSASGGTSPRSFSVASGSLPTGLTLSAAGILSGIPTQSGSFTITVQVTDANGCSATGSAYVLTIVDNRPTINDFTTLDNTVCVGSPIAFAATVGNVTGSYNFTVTNGSSTTTGTSASTNFSQNLIASGTGNQTFTLTINDNSQLASATTIVTVNALPVAILTPNFGGTLTCGQTSLTLTSSGGTHYEFARQGGGGILGMSGAIPDGVLRDGFAIVNASGVYSVTVTNSNTGCRSTATTTVYSNTAVITVSNPATVTGTLNTAFNQTFTASGGVVPRSFSLASGSLPTGLSLNTATGVLSGTPTQTGNFPFTVQATDANGCLGVSAIYTLMINSATPTLTGFAVSPSPVCAGSPLSFTASVGNFTGSYTYTLTNGSNPLTGTASTSTFSQLLTASGSGVQTFTLTVSSSGQLARATTLATVTQPAIASITYPGTLYCTLSSEAPSPTFTGTSGGSYSSVPSGLSLNSTTGQFVTNTSQPGSYTVSYTLPPQGGCPAVVATASLTIASPPTLGSIQLTQPTCAVPTGTISVNAAPAQGTIEYSKDGITWQLSGVFSGLLPGTYTIQARVQSAAACIRTISNLTIDPVPTRTASISYPAGPYCQNASTTYAPTRSGLSGGSFSSSPVGLSINSGGTVFPIFSQPGSYTVSYTLPAQESCPAVIATASITITAAPTFVFGGGFPGVTQPTCVNPTGTISLSAIGNGAVEYSRDNGATWQASGIFANLPPNQAYTILTQSVAYPGCTRSLSLSIDAVPLPPVASILTPASSTLSCTTPSLSLTATGGGTYRWNDNTSSPTKAVSTSGIYSVTVTSPGGCTASASVTIDANQIVPQVSISASTTVLTCANPSATLTATGSGSVRWNTGSTANQISVGASGIYSATLTSPNGCTASASVTINANQAAPQVSISASSTVLTCVSPTVTLTAVGTGSVRWNTGSADSQITIATAGLYSVTLTAPGGCTASASVTVNADQTAPQVGITASSTVLTCINPSITLTVSGSGSIRWSTGSTDRQINVNTASVYSVTLTAANGCTASTSVTINANTTLPQVSISASTTVLTCANPSATLTANGTGAVRWSTGSTDPQISVNASGIYSATLTSPNGCTASASVTINANQTAPQVSISASSTVLTCVSPSVTLTATGTGIVRWSTGSTENQLSVSVSGTYSVTLASPGGCTASASVTIGTDQTAPQVSITASSTVLTCLNPSITLTASGSGPFRWSTGSTQNQITVSTAGLYSVKLTAVNGCTATAWVNVESSTTLGAPTLVTQSGQANITVELNSTPVTLLASGCAGTISWTGSNNTGGTGTTILVPTTQPGTLIYQAVCQQGSCTSPPASVTVNVAARPASSLMVLHRDVDNYANNNAIQPMIQLLNTSAGSLTLSAITLRYYLTVEGAAALSNLSINYAQVGNQNVRLRYVPLNPAQQGASGYVEYSFSPDAGSLTAGANSGSIQSYFAKSDYSGLNELDDYSYAVVRDQLVGNPRITAYYNGALIWGVEPGNTNPFRALRALTESKNGPSATQISTYLTIRNEGNVPVNYSELKARYYFTSDGPERLLVEVDEGQVSTQLVALSPAVGGANYYLEVRFNQGGQLAPGASTSQIRYRISKPDGGRFDQVNDYSYQEQPAEPSSNNRVTLYVGTERVWGADPGGAARQAVPEQMPQLEVTVMDNPVRGDVLSVAIKGADSQPLHIQLVTTQGGVITRQQVASAQAQERQQLSLAGQSAGVYLLDVSSPTQRRTIRVLKVD